MIADLAKSGLAIILISSEMPELLGMCERIVVLREGRQMASFDRAEATQEKVLARRNRCRCRRQRAEARPE